MVLAFNNIVPQIHNDTYISETASVIGDVILKEGASVWFGASVRGDVDQIIIGENSNVQDNASLHTSEHLPLTIGRGVTVGHNAVLHSCTIGDNSLIGMGAIVLDGAKLGDYCMVGAGAVVTGKTDAPAGSLLLGNPARIVRELTEKERQGIERNAVHYIEMAAEQFGE